MAVPLLLLVAECWTPTINQRENRRRRAEIVNDESSAKTLF
jgi:hypothetical protein